MRQVHVSCTSDETLLPRHFKGGRLRRLRGGDLVAFQAYRQIPEVARYQGWSAQSDAEALSFLTETNQAALFTRGGWVQLGIAEPEGDYLIGDIGIYVSEDALSSEIGFTLAPAAQGRGIGTLAVREALLLLFRNTAATEVLAITDTRNVRSVRLLERVGFTRREAREVIFRGEPCCEQVHALALDDAFAAFALSL